VRLLTLFWGYSSFNMGSNFYFCCLLHLSTCSPVNCVKSSSLNWTVAHSDSCCVILTTLPQRVFWLQAATFHHTEWQNITKMCADCGNSCNNTPHPSSWRRGTRRRQVVSQLRENLAARRSSNLAEVKAINYKKGQRQAQLLAS
jgi:hypothetical protein